MTLWQDWPALRDHPRLAELITAERLAGQALIADGTIVRIWRMPGQRANVGVWRAADATDLVGRLDRLPLRPWLDAEVLALAEHELESSDASPSNVTANKRTAST